jgi:hypothetical protein
MRASGFMVFLAPRRTATGLSSRLPSQCSTLGLALFDSTVGKNRASQRRACASALELASRPLQDAPGCSHRLAPPFYRRPSHRFVAHTMSRTHVREQGASCLEAEHAVNAFPMDGLRLLALVHSGRLRD